MHHATPGGSPGRVMIRFGYIKYSLTDTLQSKRMWKRAYYYQVAVKSYLWQKNHG